MSKAGDVFRNLYRDLRDRRLLPVVIALAAAIVAVPILLGGGSSQPPPAPPTAPAAGVAGSESISPVVLAAVPGLRDYRKRLDRFHSRDPFKQQMTGSNTAQGGKGNLEPTGSSASTSTATSSPTGSTDVTTSPSEAPADTTTSDAAGTPHGGGGNGGKPEHVVETTIDVRVGRAGETKVLKGVEALEFLPGDKRPVVQFVEGDRDGTHAAFVVSPDVTETAGDGRCDPGRNDCQYVLMEKGDLRTFVYGDRQETYRLELLAIHRKVVPASRSKG